MGVFVRKQLAQAETEKGEKPFSAKKAGGKSLRIGPLAKNKRE